MADREVFFFFKKRCMCNAKTVSHCQRKVSRTKTKCSPQPIIPKYSSMSDVTHTALTQGQIVADAEETLVIRRMLVYLWRGQLPQGRDKGSSLANPACNKQYNTTLLQQTPWHTQFCQHVIGMQEKLNAKSFYKLYNRHLIFGCKINIWFVIQ